MCSFISNNKKRIREAETCAKLNCIHTKYFERMQTILYIFIIFKYANLLDKISLFFDHVKKIVHIIYILKMCNLFWTHSIGFVCVQLLQMFLYKQIS